MPKGQYDRTKTKEQRAAEKAASPAKAVEKVGKRKYTKRADKVVNAAPVVGDAGDGPLAGKERVDAYLDSNLFNTIVNALPTLKGTELYQTALDKVSAILERLEPAPVKVEKVEKVEAAPAPTFAPAPNAVPAPLPYTPAPIPFNGSSPA